MPTVRCKHYHDAKSHADPGVLRSGVRQKSRCPGWAGDPKLRSKLIEEAIHDPQGVTDAFGRPKVIWNAVAGTVFIGVSTNESANAYNCYPNAPTTALHSELSRRAERTIADLMPNHGERA